MFKDPSLFFHTGRKVVFNQIQVMRETVKIKGVRRYRRRVFLRSDFTRTQSHTIND